QRTGSNGFNASPSNDSEILLISPETVNLGNGAKQVRFWVNYPYTGYPGTKIEVYSMNGKTSTATKTLLQSIPLTTSGWTEYIVPFPATTDDYFAFSFYGAPSQYPNIYLDDINYEDMSPCIFPLNLQVGTITQNSATV